MAHFDKRAMPRSERFVILLTKREAETIGALADAERLPASTAARRLLLEEAEKRGLSARAEGEKQYATTS